MRYLLIILTLLIGLTSQATTYYFSQSGSDSNNGLSEFSPKKTITHLNTLTLLAGDNVLFKKGDTWTGETIVINDSGVSGSPITFGAYGTGTNPIITGFTSVTAWTNLGSNIWESTSAVSSLSDCKMVTINGVNTPMGRYPNYNSTDGGFLTFQSHTVTSITSSSLSGTPNWTGAEVVIRSARYVYAKRTISSQSTGTLNYSTSTTIHNDGYGFFIQNDVRTLDAQNEWYYNPTTKKIRIYSTSQPTNVKIASVENLVVFDKLSYNYSLAAHIKIENIDLIGSNGNLIHTYPSLVAGHRLHHVEILNCSFLFAGYHAILALGDYMTIENNTISNINGSGIYCDYGKGIHSVKNNVLTNISLVYGQGNPLYGDIAISYSNAKSATIEANSITNCGFNGISFNADSAMVLKNNYINNFNFRLDDGGAITTGNNNIYGTKIDGNICVYGGYGDALKGTSETIGAISVGIYLDDNSANIEVSNNTIAECSWAGMYLHNSNTNNVHHNTVFNCGYTQIRTSDDALGGDIYANTIQNNVFVAKESTQLCAVFNSNQNNLSTIGTLNNNVYARPLDDNITIVTYQPSTGSANRNLAGWKTFSSQDAASTGSPFPITSTDDITFAYNETAIAKTVVLPYTCKKMNGTYVGNTILLAAYSSEVLFKQASPNPPSPTKYYKTRLSPSGKQYVNTSGRPLIFR